MSFLKRLFNVYISGSFHVALMVLSFHELTRLQWELDIQNNERLLVFCLAFLGYNGIKYYPISDKIKVNRMFYRLVLGFCSFFLFVSLYLFFYLNWVQQLLVILSFLFCCAYVFPFPKVQQNLRNIFGVKIFIVATCWTLITAVLPLMHVVEFSTGHVVFFLSRFILIFVATLPFEISDFSHDVTTLGTIPQIIGIAQTRALGLILLFTIVGLTVFLFSLESVSTLATLIIVAAYSLSLLTISPSSSKNITLFWVEAIPLVGLAVFLLKSFLI
ncbi:MAG: hypothetical protein ACPH63_04915 [Flavobacteriaceae bacterium]